MELYPGVKITIGPAIENGFYYDFEFPDGVSISEDDLPAIEARMAEHVKAAEPFVREDVPVEAARERFAGEHQAYKVELIDDLVRDAGQRRRSRRVSLYTNGPFTDLCRGPHAPDTGRIKAFKLQSVAGAYWRGDSNAHDADADLRHRVLLQGRPRRAPRAARAGPRARPPPAGARARPLPLLRALSRRAVLAPARDDAVERARATLPARREPRPRLQRGQDAACSTTSSSGRPPGTGRSTASNMFFTEDEARRWASSR